MTATTARCSQRCGATPCPPAQDDLAAPLGGVEFSRRVPVLTYAASSEGAIPALEERGPNCTNLGGSIVPAAAVIRAFSLSPDAATGLRSGMGRNARQSPELTIHPEYVGLVHRTADGLPAKAGVVPARGPAVGPVVLSGGKMRSDSTIAGLPSPRTRCAYVPAATAPSDRRGI